MIDFSKSSQYTLSIRLGTDGFSFSVFTPLEGNGHTVFNREVNESLSLTANLKQAFREVEWLSLPYRRVNVLMADRRYTFVPLEFFEDEQAEQLFYYNHPERENEQVRYNILRNNIVVLFGMDKSACSFLEEQYASVKFYSQSTPCISYFAAKSRLGNSRKMYAHLRKADVDIYCYERGRLLFANSFACTNTADRVYYLLYIWKQLGFEQERDELHLAGCLCEKEQLLSELRRFVRQVFIMNPVENIDFQAITSCE